MLVGHRFPEHRRHRAIRSRPVHSTLLGAGVPIVEHMCHLARLPERDFRFFAVPAKVAGFGSWPVRAFGHVLSSNDRLGISSRRRFASAELEVIAVPSIGMKLTNLRRLAGREWLWRSDQIPLAPPRPGASYVETADSGGWDECFPDRRAVSRSRCASWYAAAAGPWRAVELHPGPARSTITTEEPRSPGPPRARSSPTNSTGTSPWTPQEPVMRLPLSAAAHR